MMLRRRLMDLLTGVYHVRLLWNRGTGRHAHVRSRRAVNNASTRWRRWWLLLLMRLLLLLVLVLLCNNGLNHGIEPFMPLLNLAKHETKIIQIYNEPWIGGSQKIALLLNSHDYHSQPLDPDVILTICKQIQHREFILQICSCSMQLLNHIVIGYPLFRKNSD
jgi:hypothetical protein